MVLRHADTDGRCDHHVQGLGHCAGDQFRAQGVGADKPVGAVLFGGPHRHENARGPFKIVLDLGPGAKLQAHDDGLP